MIRNVLFVLAALAAVSCAHAQIGVYGMVNVESLGGIKDSPLATQPPVTSPSYPVAYRTSVDPIGGTGGVYYDFRNVGPIRLGVDLRGSILTQKQGGLLNSQGSGVRLDSGLAGVRVSFHTRFAPLKPYVQGSAGIGRTNYGVLGPSSPNVEGNGLVNNFEYHAFAGLDIKLLPVVDFRLAEFGYGGLNPFGNDSHNYPLRSVSSGFVFHLPTF